MKTPPFRTYDEALKWRAAKIEGVSGSSNERGYIIITVSSGGQFHYFPDGKILRRINDGQFVEVDPPSRKVVFTVFDGIVLANDGAAMYRVGMVDFDRNAWYFTPLMPNGVEMDNQYIEIDESREQHLLQMEQESRTGAQSEAVLMGHLAAIKVQAEIFKAESADLAEIGAILLARRWWRETFITTL